MYYRGAEIGIVLEWNTAHNRYLAFTSARKYAIKYVYIDYIYRKVMIKRKNEWGDYCTKMIEWVAKCVAR